MLILLDHAIPDEALRLVQGPHLRYRPELAGQDRAGEPALVRPDVLLTRTEPDESETGAWRTAAGGAPVVVTEADAVRDPDADTVAPAAGSGGGPILLRVADAPDPQRYADILALAERTWWVASSSPALADRLATARRTARRRTTDRRTPAGRSVALVGVGVVNLVTALRLLRDGHRVTLFDSAPDPRASAHWTAYGSSRGGGDARMFTLTEADGYHRTAESDPVPFGTPLEAGGWLMADPAGLSPAELAWARDNARIPPWLGRAYTEDILLFNRLSKDLWQELLGAEPTLADGVGLREGVLRLYTDHDRLRAQIARQDRVGATLGVHSPGELARRHPPCATPAPLAPWRVPSRSSASPCRCICSSPGWSA